MRSSTGRFFLLDSMGLSLSKEVNVEGSSETTTYTPADTLAWSKELESFRSMDITRPTLRDKYTVLDSLTDKRSTITYRSKNPEETNVDLLRVVLNQAKQPIEISSIVEAKNNLYDSYKELSMQFETISDQSILKSYGQRGWQKMVSRDKTAYQVTVSVDLP